MVRRTPVGAVAGKDGRTLTWTLRDFKPTDDVEITYRPATVLRTAMRGED